MRVGIVGLPNAGKSTLFSALTRAEAEIANYPFTTIEPNVAVVPVADERLDRVAEVIGASEILPDTILFHDIAGLVRGAHAGEGLGNQFLSHIRETDAIVHVVRAHGDERVVHPDGVVDPVADAEVVEAELLYADLEQAERRLERVVKQARGGDKVAAAEEAWLRAVVEALQAGRPVRTVPEPDEAPGALRRLTPLTAKPVLIVANVDEGTEEVPAALAEHARTVGAGVVAVSARIEAELAALDPNEAEAMRAELGAGEPGLTRVIRGAFALLDLIAFFTADADKPAQSRHLRRGLTAWHAAGVVHTDMQRGFVRAEVVAWDELVDAGGYAAARERGTLRIEGRDYVVADGDVVHIRFTR
ncbi:MAG: redox-regulated ATPase YchF [Solirubrobacteraceae bacterium]